MPGLRTDTSVEIGTPAGILFRGRANAIEFRTSEGLISINTFQETYLSMLATARLTLRQGDHDFFFELKNASAGWRNGTLTIIAEEAVALPEANTSADTSKPS